MLVERADARQRRKNSTYFAHVLHRFKGKFYPQLAKALMNLSGIEPGRSLVVDPFGGSGTVALEGTLQGFDVVTIDCNPLATAIADAKLSLVAADPRETNRLLDRVTYLVRAAPLKGSSELTEFAPQTMPELERWFPAPVLSKLNWLLSIIRGESTPGFLDVLVSDIIREISQQEPKDLRIRRRSAPIDDAPVYDLFLSRVEETRRRLNVFWRDALWHLQRIGSGQAILGSSADPKTFRQLGGRRIDAVVSSPPYAAALPYIDTDRLSLAAVFGISSSERRSVEGVMIGRARSLKGVEPHTNLNSLARCRSPYPPRLSTSLNAYRDAVEADPNAGFRRLQAPAVLHRYFCSMSDVLSNLREHMDRATRCWFVLGDSRSTIGAKSLRIPNRRRGCLCRRIPWLPRGRPDCNHADA